MTTLLVNEVYASVQGEGTRAGQPFVFVRLTGCALRCVWCDTSHAFYEGVERDMEELIDEVLGYGIAQVLLTGGEPLEQACVPILAALLVDEGCTVLVETGGHVSIDGLPEQVVRIVDIKCPGSKMAHRNRWENVPLLRPHDELKFVLADRADYDYARAWIAEHKLSERVAALLFSPVHGALDPAELSAWLVADRMLMARLNIQLHKMIWPSAERGR